MSEGAQLPPEKYRLDSAESPSALSSPYSPFIKRAFCASGKSAKLLVKGVVNTQNVSWRTVLEAKQEEKRGCLTDATQRHDLRRRPQGLPSWGTRSLYHDGTIMVIFLVLSEFFLNS